MNWSSKILEIST